MDATPISFDTATRLDAAIPAGLPGAADPVAAKWTALHDAAFVVATLAGVEQPMFAPELRAFPDALRAFPDALRAAPHWRHDLAEQGVDDLVAVMEPGLAALIAVHGSGADATAPARALWQEFTASRDMLLALVLPRD